MSILGGLKKVNSQYTAGNVRMNTSASIRPVGGRKVLWSGTSVPLAN